MRKYEVLRDAKKYIETFLCIKTKENEIVPFRLNSAQKRLYDCIREQQAAGKPIRIIILKSRQMGFSTLTEALIYFKTATRKNVNSFIITHKDEATTNLFNMSKLFQEKNLARPLLKNSNAKELIFENPTKNPREKERVPGLKSKIKCATAGGKGVGRSDTLTNVHASELAFWPGEIGETYAGLMQAVPATRESMVIIESTANGFNFFKQMWDDAVAGRNDYVPFFAAWYEMDEYRRDWHGEKLTAEEEELKAAFGLDNEQLMWRRWCIRNNCNNDMDLFHQEYPSTPEEAFIATGSGVFDNRAIVIRLRTMEEAPRRGRFTYEETQERLDRILLKERSFTEDEKGEILLFKEPEKGRPYTLGGDTAGEGSDSFTVQVIDNITGEEMARLKWQSCDEDTYAKQVYCLGRYYNDALAAVETNFSTHPQRVLEYLHYPNLYVREVYDNYEGRLRKSFGFQTNGLTRPVLVATMQEFMRNNLHLVHDRDTLQEMVQLEKERQNKLNWMNANGTSNGYTNRIYSNYDNLFGEKQSLPEYTGMTKDELFDGYNDMAASLEEQRRALLSAALAQNTAEQEKANSQYDELAKQAYILKRQNENALPQQLAALGISGGGSESANLELAANYQNNLASNEQARQQMLKDYALQALQARTQADSDISGYYADAKQQAMSAWQNEAANRNSWNQWAASFGQQLKEYGDSLNSQTYQEILANKQYQDSLRQQQIDLALQMGDYKKLAAMGYDTTYLKRMQDAELEQLALDAMLTRANIAKVNGSVTKGSGGGTRSSKKGSGNSSSGGNSSGSSSGTGTGATEVSAAGLMKLQNLVNYYGTKSNPLVNTAIQNMLKNGTINEATYNAFLKTMK